MHESLTTYRKSMRLKTSAFLVLLIFLFGTLFQSVPVEAQSVQSQPGLASTLSIPHEIGHVREIYADEKSDELVVHIQDAHANYDAQKNIQALLGYLSQSYRVEKVYVEGSEGELNVSLYKAFPLQAVKETVIDEYVQAAQITGAEAFAICSDTAVALEGVEDEALYFQQIKTYRAARDRSEDVHTFLARLAAATRQLSLRELSPEMQTFFERRDALALSQDNYLPLYRYLIAAAKEVSISLDRFSTIAELEKISLYEKNIDVSKIASETAACVQSCIANEACSDEDIEELAFRELEFKGGRMTPFNYYAFLKNIAAERAVDFKSYENLNRYYYYLQLVNQIDAHKLDADRKRLERAVIKTRVQTSKEKETIAILDGARVLKKVMTLKATPEEYRLYTQYAAVLKKWLHVESIYPAYITIFERFYEEAEEREDAFVEKLLSVKEERSRKDKPPIKVLIAGGYHTPGITTRLKESRTSFVVVAPKVTEAIHGSELYEKMMQYATKFFGVNEGTRGGTLQIVSAIAAYGADRGVTISEELKKSVLPRFVAALHAHERTEDLIRTWNRHVQGLTLTGASDHEGVQVVEHADLLAALQKENVGIESLVELLDDSLITTYTAPELYSDEYMSKEISSAFYEAGYQITNHISSIGLHAHVYKAIDINTRDLVAVKLAQDTSLFNDRVEVVINAFDGAAHPNVCTIYEAGTIAGREYQVLEYIEMQDYIEIDDDGFEKFLWTLNEEQLRMVITQVVRALIFYFRHNVSHGDIYMMHPHNVLIRRSDLHVKVIDPYPKEFIRGQREDVSNVSLVLNYLSSSYYSEKMMAKDTTLQKAYRRILSLLQQVSRENIAPIQEIEQQLLSLRLPEEAEDGVDDIQSESVEKETRIAPRTLQIEESERKIKPGYGEENQRFYAAFVEQLTKTAKKLLEGESVEYDIRGGFPEDVYIDIYPVRADQRAELYDIDIAREIDHIEVLEGSVAQCKVSLIQADGEPAVLIEEVQPSHAYRVLEKIAPDHYSQYVDWEYAFRDIVIRAAREFGLEYVYAKPPKFAKQQFAGMRQGTVRRYYQRLYRDIFSKTTVSFGNLFMTDEEVQATHKNEYSRIGVVRYVFGGEDIELWKYAVMTPPASSRDYTWFLFDGRELLPQGEGTYEVAEGGDLVPTVTAGHLLIAPVSEESVFRFSKLVYCSAMVLKGMKDGVPVFVLLHVPPSDIVDGVRVMVDRVISENIKVEEVLYFSGKRSRVENEFAHKQHLSRVCPETAIQSVERTTYKGDFVEVDTHKATVTREGEVVETRMWESKTADVGPYDHVRGFVVNDARAEIEKTATLIEAVIEEDPRYSVRKQSVLSGKETLDVYLADVGGKWDAGYLRVGPILIITHTLLQKIEAQKIAIPREHYIVVRNDIQYTQFLVSLIATLLTMDLRNTVLEDDGAGEGVVSLIALHLGAKKVVPIELERDSIQTGRDNFVLNGYGGDVCEMDSWQAYEARGDEDFVYLHGNLLDWFDSDLKKRAAFIGADKYIRLANIGRYYSEGPRIVDMEMLKDGLRNPFIETMVAAGYVTYGSTTPNPKLLGHQYPKEYLEQYPVSVQVHTSFFGDRTFATLAIAKDKEDASQKKPPMFSAVYSDTKKEATPPVVAKEKRSSESNDHQALTMVERAHIGFAMMFHRLDNMRNAVVAGFPALLLPLLDESDDLRAKRLSRDLRSFLKKEDEWSEKLRDMFSQDALVTEAQILSLAETAQILGEEFESLAIRGLASDELKNEPLTQTFMNGGRAYFDYLDLRMKHVVHGPDKESFDLSEFMVKIGPGIVVNFEVSEGSDTRITGYKDGAEFMIKTIMANTIVHGGDALIIPMYINMYEENNRLIVTLRDDGNGFDLEALRQQAVEISLWTEEEARDATEQEIVDLVFEKFLSRRFAEGKAHGLGLWLCRKVIEEYFNGSITAKNIRNKVGDIAGVQFTLSFPRVDKARSIVTDDYSQRILNELYSEAVVHGYQGDHSSDSAVSAAIYEFVVDYLIKNTIALPDEKLKKVVTNLWMKEKMEQGTPARYFYERLVDQGIATLTAENSVVIIQLKELNDVLSRMERHMSVSDYPSRDDSSVTQIIRELSKILAVVNKKDFGATTIASPILDEDGFSNLQVLIAVIVCGFLFLGFGDVVDSFLRDNATVLEVLCYAAIGLSATLFVANGAYRFYKRLQRVHRRNAYWTAVGRDIPFFRNIKKAFATLFGLPNSVYGKVKYILNTQKKRAASAAFKAHQKNRAKRLRSLRGEAESDQDSPAHTTHAAEREKRKNELAALEEKAHVVHTNLFALQQTLNAGGAPLMEQKVLRIAKNLRAIISDNDAFERLFDSVKADAIVQSFIAVLKQSDFSEYSNDDKEHVGYVLSVMMSHMSEAAHDELQRNEQDILHLLQQGVRRSFYATRAKSLLGFTVSSGLLLLFGALLFDLQTVLTTPIVEYSLALVRRHPFIIGAYSAVSLTLFFFMRYAYRESISQSKLWTMGFRLKLLNMKRIDQQEADRSGDGTKVHGVREFLQRYIHKRRIPLAILGATLLFHVGVSLYVFLFSVDYQSFIESCSRFWESVLSATPLIPFGGSVKKEDKQIESFSTVEDLSFILSKTRSDFLARENVSNDAIAWPQFFRERVLSSTTSALDVAFDVLIAWMESPEYSVLTEPYVDIDIQRLGMLAEISRNLTPFERLLFYEGSSLQRGNDIGFGVWQEREIGVEALYMNYYFYDQKFAHSIRTDGAGVTELSFGDDTKERVAPHLPYVHHFAYMKYLLREITELKSPAFVISHDQLTMLALVNDNAYMERALSFYLRKIGGFVPIYQPHDDESMQRQREVRDRILERGAINREEVRSLIGDDGLLRKINYEIHDYVDQLSAQDELADVDENEIAMTLETLLQRVKTARIHYLETKNDTEARQWTQYYLDEVLGATTNRLHAAIADLITWMGSDGYQQMNAIERLGYIEDLSFDLSPFERFLFYESIYCNDRENRDLGFGIEYFSGDGHVIYFLDGVQFAHGGRIDHEDSVTLMFGDDLGPIGVPPEDRFKNVYYYVMMRKMMDDFLETGSVEYVVPYQQLTTLEESESDDYFVRALSMYIRKIGGFSPVWESSNPDLLDVQFAVYDMVVAGDWITPEDGRDLIGEEGLVRYLDEEFEHYEDAVLADANKNEDEEALDLAEIVALSHAGDLERVYEAIIAVRNEFRDQREHDHSPSAWPRFYKSTMLKDTTTDLDAAMEKVIAYMESPLRNDQTIPVTKRNVQSLRQVEAIAQQLTPFERLLFYEGVYLNAKDSADLGFGVSKDPYGDLYYYDDNLFAHGGYDVFKDVLSTNFGDDQRRNKQAKIPHIHYYAYMKKLMMDLLETRLKKVVVPERQLTNMGTYFTDGDFKARALSFYVRKVGGFEPVYDSYLTRDRDVNGRSIALMRAGHRLPAHAAEFVLTGLHELKRDLQAEASTYAEAVSRIHGGDVDVEFFKESDLFKVLMALLDKADFDEETRSVVAAFIEQTRNARDSEAYIDAIMQAVPDMRPSLTLDRSDTVLIVGGSFVNALYSVTKSDSTMLDVFRLKGLFSYGKVVVAVDPAEIVAGSAPDFASYVQIYSGVLSKILGVDEDRVEFFELQDVAYKNFAALIQRTEAFETYVVYSKDNTALFSALVKTARMTFPSGFYEITQREQFSFSEYVIADFVDVLHEEIEQYHRDVQIRIAA